MIWHNVLAACALAVGAGDALAQVNAPGADRNPRSLDQVPSTGLPWGKVTSQFPSEFGRDGGKPAQAAPPVLAQPTLQPGQVSILNNSSAKVVIGIGDSETRISRLIETLPGRPAVFTITSGDSTNKAFIKSADRIKSFVLVPGKHYQFAWSATLEPELVPVGN